MAKTSSPAREPSSTKPTVTRRQALKAVAVLGSVFASGSVPKAPASEASSTKTATLGFCTLGFDDLSNQELAETLAASGVHLVQLMLSQRDSRYWEFNSRTNISSLAPERCKAIAQAYRSAKVQIRSLSVYTNLVHPDEAERKANLDFFEGMMKVARAMDVDTLVTEAGHYNAVGPDPRVEYFMQEDVWHRTVATGKQLAALAERHNVTVLFEPFYRSFLASAKRARLFLEEVGSPRIRALLDPANLIEVNDLEEMFQQLKPWIECIHAKDRKLHVPPGVAAGKGDLDYPSFVRLANKYVPKAPLILEYVTPKDYKDALAFLRKTLTAAGLKYQ